MRLFKAWVRIVSGATHTILKIPIAKIKIPEVRARSQFTDEQLEFLKASLGKYGLLSYPIVRPLPDGSFELIDGEHRVKTAQEQGIQEIECLVLQADDRDAAIINILMNVARGQQDPLGIAVAIDKAVKAGMPYEEIAKIFNRSVSWVKFYHSLLELPEEYQQALREGKLTVSHIREAARLQDPYEIDNALRTAINLGWNATTLKHYVDNRLEQLRAHYETCKETGIVTPPPPPEPEKLVKYSQCLICGRMVPRENIYLPATCQDCYQLARYVVQNCGTGNEAMQYIYQALMHYNTFLQMQQQYLIQQQYQQMAPKAPSSQASVGHPPAGPQQPQQQEIPMTPQQKKNAIQHGQGAPESEL